MNVDEFLKQVKIAGKGKGFKMFLTADKKPTEIVWRGFVSIEMGGKHYKSGSNTENGRFSEVLWRIRNRQPN